MIRLSTFTPRMWLIVLHDLTSTTAAIVASFFIRFEEAGLIERWRLLAIVVPVFVAYAVLVYGFFGLYKSKWRFTSLPDLYNIVRAALCWRSRCWRSTMSCLAPNFYGTFFFGKITIILYWLAAESLSGRPAHCLPVFPLYSHAPACESRRIRTNSRAWPRRRCRGAAAGDRERRGQQDRPVGILSPSLCRSRASCPRYPC